MIEPVVYPIPVEKPAEARDFVPRPEEKPVDSDTVSPPRRITQEMKPVVVPPPPLVTTESASIKSDDSVEAVSPEPAPITSTSSFDTVKMATGEMSVFELFGLPRPSQTQEINRVVIPKPLEEPVELPSVVSIKPSRIGLRLVLRRKRVSIRRPI
jgi:hypothetical protein